MCVEQVPERLKNILIVGGGTAGWMTAAALIKFLDVKNYQIQLVESETIGTVGVGEATIPSIIAFNRMLGVDEREFMRATQATFKIGIEFQHWGMLGDSYIHPFGGYGLDIDSLPFYHYFLKLKKKFNHFKLDDFSACIQAAKQNKFARPTLTMPPFTQLAYAYHFDAGLYANYLRVYAEAKGVHRIEGEVVNVNLDPESGFIDSISLKNGTVIDAELFIDCSGFKGLLIEQALNTGFEDWGHWLLCDSAITVPSNKMQSIVPYTRSAAHGVGWQWRIPLQHRTGNGYVYSSRYIDDASAKKILLENIAGDVLAEPKMLRFKPGMRRKFWNKNCVAIGLSSGFLEPLESTSIHLIQKSISVLLEYFPSSNFEQSVVDKYNERLQTDFQMIRDFIILHYKVNNRDDSAFWRYCRAMQIPENLIKKIRLFESAGRIVRDNNELFAEDNWFAVMQGQGMEPRDYSPLVDVLSDVDLSRFSNDIKEAIASSVKTMPIHSDFISTYCSA